MIKTTIRRTKTPVSIAIIGNGTLATAYAEAIGKTKGFALFAQLAARSKSFDALSKKGGPEVLFIVCKDSEIARIAKKALSNCGKNVRLIVHSAGALGSEVLPVKKNVSRLMLHPLQTFASSTATLFSGITFGVESTDEQGYDFAESFAKAVGASTIIQLDPSDLAIYHTIAVMASNFTTLLVGALEQLAGRIDLSPEELKATFAPLIRTSLENALHKPACEVLTGPLKRNDTNTIKKHRMALKKHRNQAILELYDSFHNFAKSVK